MGFVPSPITLYLERVKACLPLSALRMRARYLKTGVQEVTDDGTANPTGCADDQYRTVHFLDFLEKLA